MRAILLAGLLATAAAQEICNSQKGDIHTTSFVVNEIDAPTKHERCYALAPPTILDASFWTRAHLQQYASGRRWYTYLLAAWVLSAATTLLK